MTKTFLLPVDEPTHIAILNWCKENKQTPMEALRTLLSVHHVQTENRIALTNAYYYALEFLRNRMEAKDA